MNSLKTAAALCALLAATPALAQHDGHGQHRGHGQTQGQGHDQHQGHAMPGGAPPVTAEPTRPHGMTGALGAYPAQREASGTAWQPDASSHGGVHLMAGDWMLMGHANLSLVYDWQEGPRGGEKGFAAGMVMAMARRALGPGALQFRAMLSPDPLMGRRGYPLHLAAGETADGVTLLVDRQHPHDFFMELSASYSLPLGPEASLFLYAGLPGEPAFGPPAFMHRMAIADSPEAPITHHWLDSTHITFGVVTAGVIVGNVKVEASRFNGREPDERRWNIETGPLDSTAVRLSWNPNANLSLQASWAHLVSPEQLEPDENSERWSASALYTRRFGRENWFSATLAWGNRDGAEAIAAEAGVGLGPWTLYGRAEYAENAELDPAAGHHGPRHRVSKVSLGAIRDFRVAPNVRIGLGAQVTQNFVPAALEPLYAGDPQGAMAFIRLKID
ncbi:MAG TPA: hypothetical protein VEC11_16900 [Allosphingosinicella sp.]|nr:hypothetical protein [Allosphingosinicella sp.]